MAHPGLTSIPEEAVPQWERFNNWWLPESVDTLCPFCGKAVNLRLVDHYHDASRDIMTSTGRCPRCRRAAYFWTISPGRFDNTDRGQVFRALLIWPAPPTERQPIQGVELIPERLRQAYLEALATYNAGVWPATGTSCRRTLEGIVAHLMPTSTGRQSNLGNALISLPTVVDLAKPLITLSHSLRQGGNISAHFDSTRTPDQATAGAMVDLLEYLLEYVFTLPAMVDELEKRMAALGQQAKEGVSSE